MVISGKIIFLTPFAIVLAAIMIAPIASAENVTPVTTPFITIDPLGNHTIDEVFFINGTTNLPANDELLLDIFTSNMNPGGWGSAFSSNVSIQTGEKGVNLWSCNATTDRWVTFPGPTPDAVPGQYIVDVASVTEPVVATQLFSLLPSESTIAPSYKQPVAAFAFSGNRTTEPYNMAPLAVQFQDTSANSPTSWLWSFGDGGTSISQNPSHTYTNAGTYTVMLTVTNVAGSNTYIMKSGITITASSVSAHTSTTNQEISSPLASTVASFKITNPSGTPPLTVQITDTSTNSPTSWSWSFGDGSTSSSQNPSHTYANAGTYTVVLSAANAAGSNTTYETWLITATNVSESVSTYNQRSTPYNDPVFSFAASTATSQTQQATPLPMILSVSAIFAGILILKLRAN
jgi:PKD repeat protein